MYTSKKKFNDGEGNEEEIRNYYMSIRKYLLCRIWKVLENDIDTKWIKEHYVDTKKLLNYFNLKKFIIGNEELVGSNDSSKLINKKKFDYLETILEKYKIDIKNNKTNNDMDNKEFEEIRKEMKKIVGNREFRQLFNLEKLSKEISDRQYLETIKSVLDDYGFEINVKHNTIRDKESKKLKQINIYTISLCSNILDLYSRCKDMRESIELDF